MSKKGKSKKKKDTPSPGERWSLFKRRIALGLYLAFVLTAAVGSQGPWWQVWNTISDKPIKSKPDYGDDYARWSWVPSDDPANPTIQVENALRPAVVALLACAVGFFFASYNLVADQNIQIPLLLAALTLAGTGIYVFYDFSEKQSIIKDVIENAEAARVKRELAAIPLSGDGVAPVASATKTKVNIANALVIRFHWGLALFLSSSMVLVIDSIYMTFVARRNPAETL